VLAIELTIMFFAKKCKHNYIEKGIFSRLPLADRIAKIFFSFFALRIPERCESGLCLCFVFTSGAKALPSKIAQIVKKKNIQLLGEPRRGIYVLFEVIDFTFK
jgi:hypothetical protein